MKLPDKDWIRTQEHYIALKLTALPEEEAEWILDQRLRYLAQIQAGEEEFMTYALNLDKSDPSVRRNMNFSPGAKLPMNGTPEEKRTETTNGMPPRTRPLRKPPSF